MKRAFTLSVFIVMVTAFLLPAYSAEVYMWVDEKGVKHISNQPPEKPAKMIGKETYERDSPEAIRRYQAEHKANEQRREAELRQRQQFNRSQEEAQKQKDRLQSQPSAKASKFSGGGVGRYRVTVKRIGSNLYEDIFTHIIIKTAACVELALMDEAILDAVGDIGELIFLNNGTSCMVVKVYRK